MRYIVVHSFRIGEDAWSVFETLEEALAEYKGCLEDEEIYTASVCAVVVSSDYDTHPLLEGLA